MDHIRFHFREILLNGQMLKGEYQLICNGKMVGRDMVKMFSVFHFQHALQYSSSSSQPTSVIPITPLQEWTSINIRVYDDNEDVHWDFKLMFDLNIHRIFIKANESLSPFMLSRLLSCFGIKSGDQILYLNSNIPIPKRNKLKNRHNI